MKMRSIFESNNESFEDAYVDFNTINSDNALMKFLVKILSRPNQKTPLIWQMKGNQLLTAVEDCVEKFNDDTDYYIIPKTATPAQVLNYSNGHIYSTREEADEDMTSGFIIFNEFSGTGMSLRNFVLNLVKNTSGYFIPKNWRILCLANIDLGDEFWEPEFEKLFNNLEYDPITNSDRYYDSDDDFENSEDEDDTYPIISEGFAEETQFMSLDEAKDKIYTILYNAVKNNEIEPDDYIYIDDDGIIVDSESGFDADMLYYARKADNFIDFDALYDGKVVIYTTPLYRFIEETING